MKTHVFLSPHTDDEAIAMAGSILRAKAAGDCVVLVLVTDNRPSARALGRFNMPADELALARLAEFIRSADVLGVDKVRLLGLEEKLINDDRDFALAALLGAFSALDHEFTSAGADDVVFHTVMGAGDIHRELGRSTQAHRLCEDAAVLFEQGHPFTEVHLHAVYVYSFPLEERLQRGMSVLELTPEELEGKRRALNAYRPGGGRIGYGYDSVPDLIDAAANDAREYMWTL